MPETPVKPVRPMSVAMKQLDAIARDEWLPAVVRNRAACAAAELDRLEREAAAGKPVGRGA